MAVARQGQINGTYMTRLIRTSVHFTDGWIFIKNAPYLTSVSASVHNDLQLHLPEPPIQQKIRPYALAFPIPIRHFRTQIPSRLDHNPSPISHMVCDHERMAVSTNRLIAGLMTGLGRRAVVGLGIAENIFVRAAVYGFHCRRYIPSIQIDSIATYSDQVAL